MDVQGLIIGDILEAGALMPTLCEEKVILQVLKTKSKEVVLGATYFGVHIGNITLPKIKEAA